MGTYVITGGASGIGKAIAEQLIREGHNTISVDRQSADIVADLSSEAGRNQAVAEIEEATKEGIDGLITSAGLGNHVPDHALITQVNYFGTVALIEGLRDYLQNKNVAIVLISSNSAPMQTDSDYVARLLENDVKGACQLAESMEGRPVYSGTKQAVTIWMRRNAADYAALGIRMNAIGPGYTQTPLSKAVEDDPNYTDIINKFIDSIPVGRPGMPSDMAEAASFLLSERASFICGSMLFVDGGHDAMLRPDQF